VEVSKRRIVRVAGSALLPLELHLELVAHDLDRPALLLSDSLAHVLGPGVPVSLADPPGDVQVGELPKPHHLELARYLHAVLEPVELGIAPVPLRRAPMKVLGGNARREDQREGENQGQGQLGSEPCHDFLRGEE